MAHSWCGFLSNNFILILEAEEKGVSLLHGNSSSFYIVFEEVFRAIFHYLSKFEVATGDLNNLGPKLRKIIAAVKAKTKRQIGQADKSPCSKVKNIEDIMVKRLETRIKTITGSWCMLAKSNTYEHVRLKNYLAKYTYTAKSQHSCSCIPDPLTSTT